MNAKTRRQTEVGASRPTRTPASVVAHSVAHDTEWHGNGIIQAMQSEKLMFEDECYAIRGAAYEVDRWVN